MNIKLRFPAFDGMTQKEFCNGLMELLRLRVQDVNFEQGIMIIRSGKGVRTG